MKVEGQEECVASLPIESGIHVARVRHRCPGSPGKTGILLLFCSVPSSRMPLRAIAPMLALARVPLRKPNHGVLIRQAVKLGPRLIPCRLPPRHTPCASSELPSRIQGEGLMRGLAHAVALACVTAVGCSDSTGPADAGPTIPSIGGVWRFSDGISAHAYASCASAGVITIAQSGAQFTGAIVAAIGACTLYDGTVVVNSGSLQMTGGKISGNQVTFVAPFCQYSGTISGSPPNRLSGLESCSISIAGQTKEFSGPWQASR